MTASGRTNSSGPALTLRLSPFDPRQTFGCGQCFRWAPLPDGTWEGVALGRVVHLTCSGEKITLAGVPGTPEEEARWAAYFDASTDYPAVQSALARDPVLRAALQAGGGIRILRQDLWEVIVSFIISQNNNIPRIRGCIERLSSFFGPVCGRDQAGQPRHALPAPSILSGLSPEDLAPVRLGYRAKYLTACAREIQDRGLPRTREDLLALTGVGPKVADCIALFGLGDRSRFPVDVWVRRVMGRLYGLPEKDGDAIRAFAADRYGGLGGYAQQYLFYYERYQVEKRA